MEDKNIIAIEIGSSKVKGAIGTYSPSGVLTVQAVEEEQLLDWVRYGAVSNVEEVAALTNRIIRKIENRVAPRKVDTIYVAMGGRSFCSVPREVQRELADEMEITESIIERLIKDAAVSQYPDREMLAVIPREFIVDKTRVEHPKGTVGRNIRMSANLITCRPQTKRNLDRLFTEKLKLRIGGYEVRQIALGDMVLSSDEKRLGCMLVDFGAETTTVSIYKHGHLQYLATLPMGSRNITRDITKLNYLEEQAEELKRTMGNASGTPNAQPARGGIDYSAVNNFVSHRCGEIIANIKEQIKLAGLTPADLPAGIVIVGRGALLTGFNERLATVTTMKIRTGSISNPNLRIADSRISPADAADVLAVLFQAARHGAEECLSTPQTEQITEKPVDEKVVEVEEIKPVVTVETETRRPKKPSWLERMKTAVANAMTETDDDDESDLKDDE